MCGLYCNHADLSPRYAPFLLGMTNTVGALPGIVGVAVTGALLDATGSWEWALFAPSALFFVTGTAVFVHYGRSERQQFDNDASFWFEPKLAPVIGPLQSGLKGASSLAQQARTTLQKLKQLLPGQSKDKA